MKTPDTSSPPQQSTASPSCRRDDLVALLWQCAAEAFGQAILVSVLGSVAVNILGGIWGEMTPSLPPGFAHHSPPEAEAVSGWNLWASLQQHRFAIIFVTLLALKLWSQTAARNDSAAGPLSRTQRLGKRVAEDWFSLIVGNAFGALISALVLTWAQQFSVRFWIFHWMFGSVLAFVHALAVSIFGTSGVNALGGWFGWYGENQLKLTFWLCYLAAICDDLGIPNLKTLGRWSWRRWRRTRRQLRCYG